jgi:hypothetical protein
MNTGSSRKTQQKVTDKKTVDDPASENKNRGDPN